MAFRKLNFVKEVYGTCNNYMFKCSLSKEILITSCHCSKNLQILQVKFNNENQQVGAREMVQSWTALTGLSEDSGAVPSTHTVADSHTCISSFRAPDAVLALSLGLHRYCACMHTDTRSGKTPRIHKKIRNKTNPRNQPVEWRCLEKLTNKTSVRLF